MDEKYALFPVESTAPTETTLSPSAGASMYLHSDAPELIQIIQGYLSVAAGESVTYQTKNASQGRDKP